MISLVLLHQFIHGTTVLQECICTTLLKQLKVIFTFYIVSVSVYNQLMVPDCTNHFCMDH